MTWLDSLSLVKTMENANLAYLNGQDIPAADKVEMAHWVASRQGLKGSYRGMFAPTEQDLHQGIRLFTGENLTYASGRHCMGQEAARLLRLWEVDIPEVKETYERAVYWMRNTQEYMHHGTYCCGRCTLAYWRHYSVGDFEHKEEFLVNGLRVMKSERDGKGKWRRFPFYYSIFTLLDLNLQPAIEELRYTRGAMECYLEASRRGSYAEKRRAILEKALAKVN